MFTTPRRGTPLALSVICLLFGPLMARAAERLVSIGARRLAIDCTGERLTSSTVVLMAGQGRPAKDWGKVQARVSTFARVCSYDREGLGDSDESPRPQSADEIISDLHTLLAAAGEKPPYLLVAHSIAGIPARRFTARFPSEVTGLVLQF
jgi:pimeloyl-ACP methyl ester carboxylesterase